MGNPFSHPAAGPLFNSIQNVFKKSKIYRKTNRYIIFLCGGSTKKYKRSLRYKFYKYAIINLDSFRLFIAEDATKDLLGDEDAEFINIAEFESFIANYTDCILIFPESPGSIAELAYFSTKQNIAKKTLIVNDVKKQHNSFINYGPIDIINHQSDFRPAILIDFHSPDFSLVKKKLDDYFSIKRQTRFKYKVFSELEPKEQLFIIFQLIYIFKVITLEGLFYCTQKIFDDEGIDQKSIKQILSFLVGVKYIKRVKEDSAYFTPTNKVNPFLEFRDYEINKLQIETSSFYSMNHKESFTVLVEM